jgi:hypothetical protein
MARPRLPIAPHLSPEEIARRYSTCRTRVEKTYWQVLWPLTRTAISPTLAPVAAQVGLAPAWVRTVLRRWNAEGPDGFADRSRAVTATTFANPPGFGVELAPHHRQTTLEKRAGRRAVHHTPAGGSVKMRLLRAVPPGSTAPG